MTNKRIYIERRLIIIFFVLNLMVDFALGHALSTLPCFQLTSSTQRSLKVEHRKSFV